MLKPPFAVFSEWREEAGRNPSKEQCIEPLRTLCFSKLAAADIVSVVLDTFCQLAQNVRSRQELSEMICQETKDAGAVVYEALCREVVQRLSLQYNVPNSHLFYFYLACELYKLSAPEVDEHLVCLALDRMEGGKSRFTEASNKFASLLQQQPEEQMLKFEKAACSKRLLKPVRVIAGLARNFAVLSATYLDLAFTAAAPQTIDAFAPAFKRMSNEDIATLLAPGVGRQLKLNTEKCLPACIDLAQALQYASLTVLDEMFIQPARKALKTSSKEPVQELASRLISICLEKQCGDSGDGVVIKDLLDDIAKEATLFRRTKLIASISHAKFTPGGQIQQRAFALMVKRAVKDEKTEEAKTQCFQCAEHFFTPELVIDADTQAMLALATQNAAGLHLIATVARALSPSAQQAIKDKLKQDESSKLRLSTSLALLSLQSPCKLNFAFEEDNEEECLTMANVLALAPLSGDEFYQVLAKLLSTRNSHAVRERARAVLKRPDLDLKQAMLACVRNTTASQYSRTTIEALLPEEKSKRDSEFLAGALVLAFRIARSLSFEKSVLPLFPQESRQGMLKFAAPLLLEPTMIDSSALLAAIELDPIAQTSSFAPLVERLDYSHVEELDLDEQSIAAVSAPTNRLSAYKEARVLKQMDTGEDDGGEEEDRARILKQGRKGRGGVRKELYSAENLEWERKVRMEQKQKLAAATGEEREKQRQATLMQALREEQALKLQIDREVLRYDQTCKCIVRICAKAGGELSTLVLPLVHLAKRSRFVGASARSVLDAYLSLAFSSDSRFATVNKSQLVHQLQTGQYQALLTLDEICQNSLNAPLKPELFEFVFPILLDFSMQQHGDDPNEQVIDAMFRLVSVHRESIVKQKREQLLPGLLKLCAKMPPATSVHCINELFADDSPPEDALIEVLMGDLGLLNVESTVRVCALTALSKVKDPSPNLACLLWFACSDVDERNRTKAEQIFHGLPLPATYYEVLITSLLAHVNAHVRQQASVAIALGIDEHPDQASKALNYLITAYATARSQLKTAEEKAQLAKESKFFDRSLVAQAGGEVDVSWQWRSGIALTLSAFAGRSDTYAEASGELGPVFEREEALESIRFVLQNGTHDPHNAVRAQMLAAGTFLIQAYGSDLGEELLVLVQSFLEQASGKSDLEADLKREGAVLLFGAAAANLDADDERIPDIAAKLVQALDTPSESVQRSVVRILPALMKCSKFKDTYAKELVDVCFEKTVGAGVRHHSTFGSRKGNAMGLAAIIKGLGIGSLKHHQLMPRLLEASNNEKVWEIRQGALFCFDELCENLGRMFEPYAIQIVEPVFLRMFSDAQGDVREAAHEASKRVMANLSGPGVGMLLPKLLLGLQSTEWRTKHAAIQMLGSVSFCAPKQLSSSLPLVVPKLIETFTDTHAKVRSAAVAALRDVQSVVKNPEIDRIAPALIAALTDPHEKTKDAVDVLFSTRFVHEVDAPSLSLLVPILKRGLKERSTETKKKSALIIGNMISMVSDARAVKPYLEDILPTLKIVLVDPIPGVRVTASKALGTLVHGLGRDGIPDFPQLYQFLIDTMHTGQSSVERQGGAQGFVEVLYALDDEDLLHDGLELQVFSKISHAEPTVREGAIWGLVFLQTAMGEEVKPWATRALDVALLSGLADDVESVRDAAFRCAKVYVGEFTTKDPQLVMSALERGLVHPSWRVKHTAVRLLGEFILQLQKTFWTGAGAAIIPTAPEALDDDESDAEGQHGEDEEDEEEEEEEASAAAEESTGAQQQEGYDGPADGVLQKLFGSERRNRLISTIYLMRNDSASQVRQAALHVWKSIVFNTPKTLRRIIGPLMLTIVQFLSSANADMQSMGGRALADVVRKLGDRVLPDIVPIVLRGLDSQVETERVGVAMGLLELVGASSKQSLEPQSEAVLLAVEKGLCDENDQVRELAGKTFNRVHVVLGGNVALQVVLDKLCADLEHDEDACMRGLMQCVESRSRDSMTYLIPKLLNQGHVTETMARALGNCLEVIPDYQYHYIPEVIRLVVREEDENVLRVYGEEVFISDTFAGNEDSIRVFCREVCSAHNNNESAQIKRTALFLLESFFNSDVDVLGEDDTRVCIQSIVKSFASKDAMVLESAIRAFAALVKHVKDNVVEYVSPVRQAVNTLISDEKYRGGAFASDELRNKYELPAFQHKQCLDAMLELYLGPLVSNAASHEVRETASIGLGEIVDVTGADGLRLHTVKIAGPLIRIVGEPFPSSLKISILSTLTKLLIKQGTILRPFLSQLQTTFVKAVKNNASDSVRVCGLQALDILLPLTPRVDPLVNELCQGCELNSESGLQMLQALYAVFQQRGGEVSLAGMTKVVDSQILQVENNVDEEEEEADDEIPTAHGAISVLLAMLEAKILDLAMNMAGGEALVQAIGERLHRRFSETAVNWRNLLVLNALLRVQPEVVAASSLQVVSVLEQALATSANPRVRAVAYSCCNVIWRNAKQVFPGGGSDALHALAVNGAKAEKDARVRHFAKLEPSTTGLQTMREEFKTLF